MEPLLSPGASLAGPVSPSGAAGIFLHPPPGRESGTQHPDKREPLAPVAPGHSLALLPWRFQGPCGADGAFGPPFHPCPSWARAHVSLFFLLLLLPHLCWATFPPSPGAIPALHEKIEARTRSKPGCFQGDSGIQTWLNPLTCSLGIIQGPSTRPGPPCQGRAGQGRSGHTVPLPSEPASFPGSAPSSGHESHFPLGSDCSSYTRGAGSGTAGPPRPRQTQRERAQRWQRCPRS